MRQALAAASAAGLLAGCVAADERFYYTDHDCLNRRTASRVLSLAAGVGLGAVGVPGGGLVVGLATDPRCQPYHLTPEGRAHVERQARLAERERRIRPPGPVVGEDGLRRATPGGRPLDTIPDVSAAPPR